MCLCLAFINFVSQLNAWSNFRKTLTCSFQYNFDNVSLFCQFVFIVQTWYCSWNEVCHYIYTIRVYEKVEGRLLWIAINQKRKTIKRRMLNFFKPHEKCIHRQQSAYYISICINGDRLAFARFQCKKIR